MFRACLLYTSPALQRAERRRERLRRRNLVLVTALFEVCLLYTSLPTTDLHDVTLKIGNIPVAGQFALHPYKDMNGDVQVLSLIHI